MAQRFNERGIRLTDRVCTKYSGAHTLFFMEVSSAQWKVGQIWVWIEVIRFLR